jgi:molybdopterin converting factor small subunit
MEVRVRLGSGLAQFASAPTLRLDLPDGATVEDLYDRLARHDPDLAPALRSALAVVRGTHVEQGQILSHGDEVALLTPVAGG